MHSDEIQRSIEVDEFYRENDPRHAAALAYADAYDAFCAERGLDPRDPAVWLAWGRANPPDSGGGTEGDADAGSSPATDDGAPPP